MIRSYTIHVNAALCSEDVDICILCQNVVSRQGHSLWIYLGLLLFLCLS